MKLKDIIIVKPEKCVGCAACIRSCPAPEANKTTSLGDGRVVTTVDPTKCIACGECVRNCPHDARDYIDGTEEAMAAIIKEPVNVIVAPAIKSVFPNKWKSILKYFKSQGCKVFDGSFGADICTWAHLRQIETGKIGKVITQPCAAIVKYIEVYKPSLLQNLSIVHSPLACEAVYLRKYLRYTNKIIALTPCIAKTNEFNEIGIIDYNVTFNKLMKYFEVNGINISPDNSEDFAFDFDDSQGQMGGIYPRPGGLRDNLWLHDPDINITNSEGVNKVYKELNAYEKLSEAIKPDVFDVLSCEFGCNVGPGSGEQRTVFEAAHTMRQYEIAAKKRRKTSGPFRGGEDKLFKEFDSSLMVKDFCRSYMATVQSPVPTDAQLEPIFKKMGKHTKEDREYNCHACGYDSCKDMAIAIARGLNSPENCLVHAKAVLLAEHSSIRRQNDKLAEVTSTCLDGSKTLKENLHDIEIKIANIAETADATGTRADTVNDLLNNVITFCEENPQMDKDTVSQLIEILRVTSDAFSDLNKNVDVTKEDSEKVKSSIEAIRGIVEVINTTLLESEMENKKEK